MEFPACPNQEFQGPAPDIESCFAGRCFEIAERRGSPPCAFRCLICSEPDTASSPMPLP
jgi:hypothetical protein